MCKVLITTVPFGDKDRAPLEQLEKNKISYLINPLGKKLTEDELCSLVGDCEVIVAGTEPITDKVMSKARNLKMISRVGIGLDSVDLMAAERRGVVVSYTPDAPAPAVAELTIGLMLSLLRSTHLSNHEIHKGSWHRIIGKRLAEVTIGLIGIGRIGEVVLRHLKGFGTPRILVNDISPRLKLNHEFEIEWVDKEKFGEKANRYHSIGYLYKDLVHAYAAADLTVCRAGMSTLTELTALRKAMLLVPIPDNQQEENARFFDSKNAVILMDQKTITADQMVTILVGLLSNPNSLQRLQHNLGSVMLEGANEKYVEFITSLIKKKK